MTTERFDVVLQGSTVGGQDVASVATELARLIKRDSDLALRLLCGQPTTLKSGVDAATGARYIEALERIGAAARLEPESLEVDADLPPPNERPPKHRAGIDVSARVNERSARAQMSGSSGESGVLQPRRTKRAVWVTVGVLIVSAIAGRMIGTQVGGALGTSRAVNETASLARNAGMPDGIFGVRFLQDLSDVRRIRPAVSQLPTGEWAEKTDWRGYPVLVIYKFDARNQYLTMILLNFLVQGNADTFWAVNRELESLYGPFSNPAPSDGAQLYAERHAGGIGLFNMLVDAPNGQVVQQVAFYRRKEATGAPVASSAPHTPASQSRAEQAPVPQTLEEAGLACGGVYYPTYECRNGK